MENIRSYKELRVYQAGMDAAMRVFELTRAFPPEERYSMVDQMRRSSRSVCANIAEAWPLRERRYPKSFIAKLNDSEGEAEEIRVWLEFARRCHYMTEVEAAELDDEYDKILGQLVRMITEPDKWTIR